MHRSLKISLLTIGGAVLSILAVLGFILTTFNNEDYRKSIIFLVNNLTDYQVEIAAPFNCSISPTPEFTAASLKLFRPGETDPLEFQDLKIKLVPTNLLRGQLRLITAGLIKEPKTLKWLLPKELLALESVRFTTDFITDSKTLNLLKIDVDGNNSRGLSLQISGTGLIEDFSAEQPFARLDLSIKVDAAASRPLQGYLPEKLPEMGPVKGSLRLIAISDRALAAKDIKLDFGRKDKLFLQTSGEIKNIPMDPDIINTGNDFHLDLQAANTAIIAERWNSYLPEIGPLRLTADFRGSKKKAQLENITFSNDNPSGIEVRINGNLAVADAKSNSGNILEKINLKAAIKAPAGAQLPGLSRNSAPGLKVPISGPLTTSFQLFGNQKEISLKNFSGNFGKTSLTAKLKALFSEKTPQITGEINIPTLFPDDFMNNLTSTPPAPEIKTADTEKLPNDKKPGALFSHQPLPRNWLHNFNCNIQLGVNKVADFQKNLKNLNLDVKMDDGRLQIDPATLLFEGGYARISLFIDDTGSTPQIRLECAVDDLDLTGLLTSLDIDSPISGKVTLHSQVSSRGISMHDLASKLDGNFGVVLEKGVIPNHLLKLVAIDVLGWSFSRTIMKEEYANINCCILSFEINQGLITSQAFIFDSKLLTITGAGTIDLTTETCDLTIFPREKRKFWATVTPVTITGSLQDPTVMAIPVKKAALLYGGVLLAPQFFLPAIGINYLWEMISKDGDSDQNPCLEYLHQQSQAPPENQPEKVPPPSRPVSRH